MHLSTSQDGDRESSSQPLGGIEVVEENQAKSSCINNNINKRFGVDQGIAKMSDDKEEFGDAEDIISLESTQSLTEESIELLARSDLVQHLANVGVVYDKKDSDDRLRSRLKKALVGLREGATKKANTMSEEQTLANAPSTDMMSMLMNMMENQQRDFAAREERLLQALETAGRQGGERNADRDQNRNRDRNPSNLKITIANPEPLEEDATYKTFTRWEDTFRNWAMLNKLSE